MDQTVPEDNDVDYKEDRFLESPSDDDLHDSDSELDCSCSDCNDSSDDESDSESANESADDDESDDESSTDENEIFQAVP